MRIALGEEYEIVEEQQMEDGGFLDVLFSKYGQEDDDGE